MLAKSTRALFQVPHSLHLRRWTWKAVTVLGLIASAVALGLIVRDQYGEAFEDKLAGVLPVGFLRAASAAEDAGAPPSEPVVQQRADPNDGRYRVLAEFLARRYRVSQDATFDLVSFAHAAGYQLGLDPLLIIAVIAVESRFNPIAESVAGAKGLMQVIPKYHPEKLEEFGGEQAVFDPRINILVGSRILKEYERRTGSTTTALQMYAGASDDAQDGYSTKVIAEKKRLQGVVSRSKRSTVKVAQNSPIESDSARKK